MGNMGFFVFGAISLIAAVVLTQIAFGVLRERHSELWADLGCPANLLTTGFPTFRKWLKFLLQKQYNELDDTGLRWLGRSISLLYMIILLWLSSTIWLLINQASN